MKKSAINLLASEGHVEICMTTDTLICTSVLLPRQARLMARELLKYADAAEEVLELKIDKENIIRTNFKRKIK